jgi:hypothetical protein
VGTGTGKHSGGNLLAAGILPRQLVVNLRGVITSRRTWSAAGTPAPGVPPSVV